MKILHEIFFEQRFIPDRPWANPYHGLDAYMGKDVSAKEQVVAWYEKHWREVNIETIRVDHRHETVTVIYENIAREEDWHAIKRTLELPSGQTLLC